MPSSFNVSGRGVARCEVEEGTERRVYLESRICKYVGRAGQILGCSKSAHGAQGAIPGNHMWCEQEIKISCSLQSRLKQIGSSKAEYAKGPTIWRAGMGMT